SSGATGAGHYATQRYSQNQPHRRRTGSRGLIALHLRNPFRDPVAVAGWLFADVLLAAAINFLATSPGATAPPPPTLPPGVPMPTPVPTATPLACNNTVVLRKIDLNVAAGAGGGAPTDQQLQQ